MNGDRNGCRNITCGIVGPNGEHSGRMYSCWRTGDSTRCGVERKSWNRDRDFRINSPCIWCATNVGCGCTAHKTVLGERER